MIIFTINLEIMSKVRAQHIETFRGWNTIQRRDRTPVKTNGF